MTDSSSRESLERRPGALVRPGDALRCAILLNFLVFRLRPADAGIEVLTEAPDSFAKNSSNRAGERNDVP